MPNPETTTRLTFAQIGDTGKTFLWTVNNGAVRLGEIRWYAPWRRYCFFPQSQTLFDAACLLELIWFIRDKMAERKHT